MNKSLANEIYSELRNREHLTVIEKVLFESAKSVLEENEDERKNTLVRG